MDFIYESNRIYAESENGDVIAEVDFPNVTDEVVDINHTFVDDSLRGQGVAGRLLQEAVKTIRQQGKKAKATCSYAVSWFAKHEEEQDLLD
ncbi:GNAT family N-acetyltransferase [Scatolibacter rhodanostii]|uniref:GNAT family N-acetyltransferase n=1 Tax=Scatolibacter rhodanostii TaxID=2014781 RepID=UPI000C07DCA3|nr:GNAT family N-acetyltransferase [Scatolibacter rhodanostii]